MQSLLWIKSKFGNMASSLDYPTTWKVLKEVYGLVVMSNYLPFIMISCLAKFWRKHLFLQMHFWNDWQDCMRIILSSSVVNLEMQKNKISAFYIGLKKNEEIAAKAIFRWYLLSVSLSYVICSKFYFQLKLLFSFLLQGNAYKTCFKSF